MRIAEARGVAPEELLADLVHEAEALLDSELSTTLLVLPDLPWEAYLELLAIAEELCPEELQIASFHPDYVFAGASPEDPANGTNRSPHPVFHLLRRAEVAEAIASHPDVEGVTLRNAELLRRMAR